MIKWKLSPTNRGGFPAGAVQLASAIFNPKWPGFYSKATS